MPELEPRGTVALTGWQSVVAAALAGAGLGWLIYAIPERFGWPLPLVPLVGSVALVLASLAVGVLAWSTYRRVQVRRESVENARAVGLLVLGKACYLGGAGLAGGYATVIAFFWDRLTAEFARERVTSSVVAVVASIGLAIAGALLERACRIPGPPSGDATPKGLPESPSTPH
jgi:hypothetical protein